MCIRDRISIAIDNLKISDITTDVITKFLDYLEIERKVSAVSYTHLQRLKLDRRYHKPFGFQSECKDTDIFVMYITKILKY